MCLRPPDSPPDSLNDAAHGDVAILLVDSEEPVTGNFPWEHVKARPGDGWDKPEAATDDHLHLMVECMESWFLADKEALEKFYGQGFKNNSLPAKPKIEEVSKSDVYRGLKDATKDTKKGEYGKGTHSFKILAIVDPAKVRDAAPSADRLLKHLDMVLR
jgi:hypothetical protein